ncbi:MAG: ABC transporter substrate-binding protein, partial [Actinomycetes bacterium]
MFLFADIRGYTDYTSTHGADAASQLVARFTGTVADVVDGCGGSVRGTWGDEVFAVFDSARDAVRAALTMQARFVAAASAPEDVPLVVGVGLDAGEAVASADADSGSAVNVAARLCSRAGPGEILATHELVHLAGAVPGARYEEHGRARLKGVSGRTAVVRIRPTSTDKAQLAAFRLVVEQLPGRRRMRRRRRAWIAGLTAAALVVGAATWSVARWRTVEAPTIAANSVGVIDADSGRLEATVTLPAGQHADAVVIGSTAAWLVDSAAGTVFRVDLATRQVVLPIPVGDTPVAAVELGGYLWVVNEGAASLSRINERTNQVVDTVPVGTKPTAIAAASGHLWVTDQADNVVIRVDPEGDPNLHTVGVGDAPAGIAAEGGMLWVANSADGTITTIDHTTLQAGPPIHVGAGPRAVLASRGSVFVANELELSVSQVDPARRQAVQKFQVGDAPSALAGTDGAVWVTDTGTSSLTRIDPDGARGTVPWSLGSSPLAIAADGPRLWVSTQPGPSAAHRGGTLTVAVSDDWFDSLDPARAYSPEAWQALSMVYDGLVGLRRTTGSAAYELVPDLADTLPTPSDGGTSYTFHLRSGITYSDGRSVALGDVRRGLEREFTATAGSLELGNPSYYAGIVGGEACSSRPQTCSLAQGITTNEGAHTVTITLSKPDPDFLYKLALPFATVVPPGSPTTGADPPAFPGTGPYKIARFA